MKSSIISKIVIVFLMPLILSGCFSNSVTDGDYSVSLKVNCAEIVEYLGDAEYGISDNKVDIVPDDGIILDVESSCNEGDTALDLLLTNLKSNKIHFEDEDGYIVGIANIYAGDCGSNSGWMFFINGELAEIGANETVLNDSDEVEFRYVVDYMTLFE